MSTTRRGFFGAVAAGLAAVVGVVRPEPVEWRNRLWTTSDPQWLGFSRAASIDELRPIGIAENSAKRGDIVKVRLFS